MSKRLLSQGSVALMKYLLSDTRISDKVFDNAEDKTRYKSITICENGTIVLGKTSCLWWNRLLACQNKIPFNDFALKVWDALVNLSTGVNGVALEKRLSTEIAKLSQREGDYDTLIKRLVDCYEHVCNNKGDSPLEGGSVKSEPKIARTNRIQVPENIVINVNGKERKVIPFRDSAGDKFVDIEYGVTGVVIK